MKKGIGVAFGLLIVGAGVGVYFLLTNLNSLVAGAIEKHGSEVTDTRVGVSGVDISLRDGRGSIRDLSVASTEGFKTREAFTLGDITIDLDVKSVTQDPIVLEEIRIKAPAIHAEVREDGSTNIDALRQRVQAYQKERASGDGVDKKIRIRRFVLEEAQITVDLTALGADTRTLTLPAIRLNDVGGAEGVPPDEVAKVILTTVARNTASEIARSEVKGLIDKGLGEVEKKLDETVTDKAKGLLDKIGN